VAFREHLDDRPPEEPGDPAVARPDPLRLRLEALAVRGAARFDPAEVRFVSALLTRASRAQAAEVEPLRARVAARLDALDAALEAHRAGAYEALDAADRGGAFADDLRDQIAGGDPLAIALAAEARLLVQRLAPAHRRERLRVGLAAAHAAHASHASHDRVSARVDELRAMPTPTERLAELDALAASLRLDVALARASSVARFEGPYNPGAIAARLLRALPAVAPAYLRALARDFDDLASVGALTVETDAAQSKRRR
jgi:hypothetical protein